MNGIDFKAVYGQDFNEMTHDERDMAVMSQLYYLRKEVKDACDKTKSIPKLEKAAWSIAGIVAWLTWVTIEFWRHLVK